MSEQPFVEPEWDDETEDFTKTTWDFWDDNGLPVRDLATLEAVTGRDADALARDILTLPMGRAAPDILVQECMNRAAH